MDQTSKAPRPLFLHLFWTDSAAPPVTHYTRHPFTINLQQDDLSPFEPIESANPLLAYFLDLSATEVRPHAVTTPWIPDPAVWNPLTYSLFADSYGYSRSLQPAKQPADGTSSISVLDVV